MWFGAIVNHTSDMWERVLTCKFAGAIPSDLR